MNTRSRVLSLFAASMMSGIFPLAARALPIGTDHLALATVSYPSHFFNDVERDLQVDGSASAEGFDSRDTSNTTSVESEGLARANLATGQLGAMAGVRTYNGTSRFFSETTAIAAFGDSFAHLSGNQPFLFSEATSSSFRFAVDGSTFRSEPTFQTDAWLRLFLLRAGSLDEVVNDDGEIFCCGYSPLVDNVIDVVTFGLTPDTNWTLDFLDPNFGVIPVDQIVTGGNIDFTFSPGGDFDWYVQLITVSAVLPTSGGPFDDYQDITDFFNTIDVSYVAPTGAAVISGSGVFPGTTSVAPVPLPGALWLLLSGLGSLGAAKRRRPGAQVSAGPVS